MWPWAENRLLKSALRLYAGDLVLSRLLGQGESALSLSSDRADLTLMFVDIVGMDFSEKPPLDSLAPFINNYLQVVTDAVNRNNGVIDSFIGDAVLTWWHDARNACLCAKEIVSEIDTLNADSQHAMLPTIKVGVGIDSGAVSLGNFGSSHRIKFTVMGDRVNLARSLCSMANANYQVPVIITSSTQQLIAGAIETKSLGTVRVKGKEDPIELFSLSEAL